MPPVGPALWPPVVPAVPPWVLVRDEVGVIDVREFLGDERLDALKGGRPHDERPVFLDDLELIAP